MPPISEPVFPDPPRKNDALFLYGALCAHPFVFTYVQKTVEVIYGPACKPDKEIFLPQCARDCVAVYKRRSGGGTVVLSPGMVITIVVDKRGPGGPIEIFSTVHDDIIEVLESSGISGVQKTGLSDLAISGRKILGSSLYLKQSPGLYFYQSALMVDSDLSLLGKYLAHPPREPLYRGKRDHADFCTTLKKEGHEISAEELSERIGRELGGRLQ